MSKGSYTLLGNTILQTAKMHQSKGMNPNITVYNELLPRQADTLHRQETFRKSLLRIANVNHNSSLRLRKLPQINTTHLKLKSSIIHHTILAPSTTHSHKLAVFDFLSCIISANNTGNPKLTAHNRSMTTLTTPVRYNSRSLLHNRHPIRVSHLSNKNLTRPELPYMAHRSNNARPALPNPAANTTARGKNPALFLD